MMIVVMVTVMMATAVMIKLSRFVQSFIIVVTLNVAFGIARLSAQSEASSSPTLPAFTIQRADQDFPYSLLLPGSHAHTRNFPVVLPRVFDGRGTLMLETLDDGVPVTEYTTAWPNRQPLDELYAPMDAARLNQFIACLRPGLDAGRLRPAFHFVLSVAALTPPNRSPCVRHLGVPTEGVAEPPAMTGGDAWLVAIARQRSLQIVGAETRSEQLAAIAAAPDRAFARLTSLLLEDNGPSRAQSALITSQRTDLLLRGDFDEIRRRAFDPLPLDEADRAALAAYD